MSDAPTEQLHNEGLTVDEVVTRASKGTLTEYMLGNTGLVQMKEAKMSEKLTSTFSEDLCALANYITTQFYMHGKYQPGYLILGLRDDGQHTGPAWTYETAVAREPTLSNELRQHMYPATSIKVQPAQLSRTPNDTAGIIIFIVYPAPTICFWDGKPYQQAGTSSHEMTESEYSGWMQKLQVRDFSAIPWCGELDAGLVLEFAKGLKLPSLHTQSAEDILRHVNVKGTMAARILFGDVVGTINFYNKDGIPNQTIKYKGMYIV